MLNSCVMHLHTGPASIIMLGGGIRYHSRTLLVRIAGTLNSQRYTSEVLEPVVIPYLHGLARSIFQQNNALHLAANSSLRIVVMYSVRDYCDMYLMHGRCNGNALLTARDYHRLYPSRRPPVVNVIRRQDDRKIREASGQQPLFTILEDHGEA
ncbi:DUF4817 domain-containing protein [Trichonephila clavipes]|uniref:DUF4817 domain-containing protein n=1 Tax=Trichonephila clavipes TaxID=2585209 RepID=A0A8X6S505_TRICX|nr:DUF4817 domain-containing protein [Trichonephila clavipes]